MRKLLVASQKGGVGKTTTSMNLAAAAALTGSRVLLLDADPLSNISTALNLAGHPQRRPLRQAGIDLPGVLVPNFVPGLDVLSPYDEGLCSDDDLDRLLGVLTGPAVEQLYGCMIVDVPPFLGGNPSQLIGSCDELLLVMRAEALAHRTLPAFLELVQRSSRAGHPLPMRGILLTLPEGEDLGCRWERELRGRFGSRVLTEVIPHDESIGEALGDGRISSHLHPDSPAGRQYHQLVGRLDLAAEGDTAVEIEQIMEALHEAAALLEPVAAPAPEPVKPAAPSVHRPRRLSRSGDIPRPTRLERPSPAPAVPPSSPVRIKVVPTKVPAPVENPPPATVVPVPPALPTANALRNFGPYGYCWVPFSAAACDSCLLPPRCCPSWSDWASRSSSSWCCLVSRLRSGRPRRLRIENRARHLRASRR